MTIFIARHGHEWSSLAGSPTRSMSAHTTYEAAVRRVNQHFQSRGFYLINGRPWDPGCSNLGPEEAAIVPDDTGFSSFDDAGVVDINGELFVSHFTHAEGEGPVGDVIEMELV